MKHNLDVAGQESCGKVTCVGSMWMKVRSESRMEALFIRCVCMLTDTTRISFVDHCYERYKIN